MPKAKRKFAKPGKRTENKYDDQSDSDSNNETASIYSLMTESQYSADSTPCDCGDENCVGDCSNWDHTEKLMEYIDGTTEKSAKIRYSSLKDIHGVFLSHCVSEVFLLNQKFSILDMFERALKRGNAEEQSLGIVLLGLLAITIGPESEFFFVKIKSYLLKWLADSAQSPSLRAKCASTLGIFGLVVDGNCEELPILMDALYNAFSGSFLKGNGVPPTVKPEMALFHAQALESWSLLSTILSPSQVTKLKDSQFQRIPELLESANLDLRIAAGEAIAVIYEVATEVDENFVGLRKEQELCLKLADLATNTNKHISKKDRKEQKASFRDILKAIENGESPAIKKKVQGLEFYIDSWCKKRQYDSLTHVLGSGMMIHLAQNAMLRDIFNLGPVMEQWELMKTRLEPEEDRKEKKSKQRGKDSASKSRTLVRQKLREKKVNITID